MRLVEFASAEEQMALWKLVSDSVWSSIAIQAKQQSKAKAAQRRKNQAKRTTRKSSVPAPPLPASPTQAQGLVKAPITPPSQPIPTQPIQSIGSVGASIGPKVVGQNNQA